MRYDYEYSSVQSKSEMILHTLRARQSRASCLKTAAGSEWASESITWSNSGRSWSRIEQELPDHVAETAHERKRDVHWCGRAERSRSLTSPDSSSRIKSWSYPSRSPGRATLEARIDAAPATLDRPRVQCLTKLETNLLVLVHVLIFMSWILNYRVEKFLLKIYIQTII